MKKQAMNPYLPLSTCIPDGEPHVFGDRVYIYGSHDQEGGEAFCILDYEVWSAPVNDLSDWRCEGISYKKTEDPILSDKYRDMYAPDVVQGVDGKYYLYYALAGGCFTGPIHVAVSDTPAGPFHYHGAVHYENGEAFDEGITFDPGVLNDNGRIYMYYGWSLSVGPNMIPASSESELKEKLVQVQMMMFEKTEEQVRAHDYGVMGAHCVELDSDMLTVKTVSKYIVPGQFASKGTSFEGHAFFEASSIRKIGDTYYYIYSSENMRELCYAISKYPDRDFVYGGVLVDHTDVGMYGLTADYKRCVAGNNHGSVEYINGQWYIFYHRQTHNTTYSRQGCAEKIEFTEDGKFIQAEITSCGMNDGSLKAEGVYSAAYACYLNNGKAEFMGTEENPKVCPYITNSGEEKYITDIDENTLIAFKYFDFEGNHNLKLTTRGEKCDFEVYAVDKKQAILVESLATVDYAKLLGKIQCEKSMDWNEQSVEIQVTGEKALVFVAHLEGKCDMLQIKFL